MGITLFGYFSNITTFFKNMLPVIHEWIYPPLIDGYKYFEEYFDPEGIQDTTDYCYYVYEEKNDEQFKNHSKYIEVTSENIELIKSYFEYFEGVMKSANRINEYNFDIESINIGDYYWIKTKEGQPIGGEHYQRFDHYSIYYYDKEKHLLTYIHTNI